MTTQAPELIGQLADGGTVPVATIPEVVFGEPRRARLTFADERRDRRLRLHSRRVLVHATLASMDILALVVAFVATELLFRGMGPAATGHQTLLSESLLFFLMLPVWPLVADVYGLYRRDHERTDCSTADELVGVFNLLTAGTWLFVLAAYVSGWAHPDPVKLSIFWVFAVATLSIGRVSGRAFYRRRLAYSQNAVVVGAGRIGQLVGRKLSQHPEYGITVVGFVDDDPLAWNTSNGNGLPQDGQFLLGPLSRLPQIVDELDIDRVVLAFSESSDERTLEAMRQIADLDVQIDVVPRLFELIGPRAVIHGAEGLPLIGLSPVRLSKLARVTKRIFDCTLGAGALLVLTPLLIVVAAAIKLESRGPVFFGQTRMGARNRPFRILKFRTMAVDADARKAEVLALNRHAQAGGDARMFKIPHDPRVTQVGRFLRCYAIDELPQLINVLRGDMSLVGPRPLILDEDRHVDGWARRRLDVKPGITGPWQVHGASAIPFGEMVQLDYLYVRTWSLWNDVVLLLRTVAVVVRGSGC